MFLTRLLPNKPVLTSVQLDRLSNILDNLGQAFFVALVLTPIIQGIDKTNILMLVLGAIDVLACWCGSLVLARGKEV